MGGTPGGGGRGGLETWPTPSPAFPIRGHTVKQLVFSKAPLRALVAPPPLKESPSSVYVHSLKLTESPASAPREGLAHSAGSVGPVGSHCLGLRKERPTPQRRGRQWSGGKSRSSQEDLAFLAQPWGGFLLRRR